MYLDVAQLLPEAAMERVEERLRSEVKSDLPFMAEVARHLIEAGGKRIRPGLVIACANISEAPPSEKSVMAGVAVELVHIGSLHHDDVMDSAATRRGVQSVNDKWDTVAAVLSGDFLLARASVLASQIGSEASELLATTIAELCEGQIREHQDAFKCDRSIASYELSIRGKTASLLSASCRLGGMTGDLSAAETDALTEFGRSYGMAFQIFDDIADITQDHDALGKPSGQDVMEGNYTLPVLLTLEVSDELAELLADDLQATDLARVLQIVRNGDGVKEAMSIACDWANKAIDSLEPLRDTAPSRNLKAAAKTLLDELYV